MSLQSLPVDIILDILQHTIYWRKNIPRVNFKHQLYLLGVFQRFRVISLPEIYNHVYIAFGKPMNCKRQKYLNKYNKTFSNYIDTNADIIALANCTHIVKSAKILINSPTTTYTELNNYIEALQFCANVWPKVSKLTISTNYNIDYIDIGETHLLQLHCLGEKYSRKLANILPNVTELSLSTCYLHSDTSGLYIQVTGAYADQLVKLTNEYLFDYTGMHKLKVIKYLRLRMEHNYISLPCVNSHTLVYLHIGNIPFNVSWAPFMNNKDDTVIEFSCLKRLSLVFRFDEATNDINVNMPGLLLNFIFNGATDDINAGTPELLLNFPKLKSLKVICKTGICPFFKMAKFPKAMEVVNIRASPRLLAQIKNMGIPTAKKMHLSS